MPDADVRIISSGSQVYWELPEKGIATWPVSSGLLSSANLLSGFLKPLINVGTPSHQETVFLTRSHQCIMDRALQRSLRIIA
jgi:hypothetical protein